MSKKSRGKGIMGIPSKGRGKCPVCGTESIKLLYQTVKNGSKVSVCKRCQHK